MKVTYEKGYSFLHGLNPLTKLYALISFSVALFLFDSLPVEAFCLLALLAIAAYLRSASIRSLMLSRFMLSFAGLIFVIQVIFTPGGDLIAGIPLVFFTLNITWQGVLGGLIVAMRFVSIILASAIFVSSTDPNELAYSLMRAGLPYRFGFMLVTALRFIPVFDTEVGVVLSAQRARGLEIDAGGFKGVVKIVRYTMLPLVVSALSKVDSMVISMEGRAFGYRRTRTFSRKGRFRAVDAVISIVTTIAIIFLLANAVFGWIELPQLMIYNN